MAARKQIPISNIPFRTRNDQLEATWCFERTDNHCMPHYHLAAEVVYVESGMMTGIIAGKEIHIHKGQMVVISSYTIHSFHTPDSSQVIVAVIPMDFVPAIHQRIRNFSLNRLLIEEPDSDLVFLLKLLLKSCDTGGNRETIQGLSQSLLGLLIHEYGLSEHLPLDSAGIMYLIIPYIQQHFTEDICLDDLAGHFNYSKSRLSHLFQQQLHMTFTEFLNRLRCRHAASLLASQNSEETILDIAGESGFHSVSTFYRVFKQIYGLSPLAYRAERSK